MVKRLIISNISPKLGGWNTLSYALKETGAWEIQNITCLCFNHLFGYCILECDDDLELTEMHGTILKDYVLCVIPMNIFPWTTSTSELPEEVVQFVGGRYLYIKGTGGEETQCRVSYEKQGFSILEFLKPADAEKAFLNLSQGAILLSQNYIKDRIDYLNYTGADQVQRTVLEQLNCNAANRFFLKLSRSIGERESRVLVLYNFCLLSDAFIPSLTKEIIQFFTAISEKLGTVEAIKFPNATDYVSHHIHESSTGRLFIEFAEVVAAKRALIELNSCRYHGKVVCCAYFPVELFHSGIYNIFTL